MQPCTYAETEANARKLFARHDIATPDLDARALLLEATGLTRAQLILRRDDLCSEAHARRFQTLIERRLRREPVGRILGRREFWGMEFQLSKETLEPRPDSETLIEAVLHYLPDREKPYKICDFGTGSGCLLAALLREYPQSQGIGIDISRDAIQTAQLNHYALGLSPRASFALGNWGDARELTGRLFDIIISNPPYIPANTALSPEVAAYDPEGALFAGEDGLTAYRNLLPQLSALLAKEGIVALELGVGQGPSVREIAATSSLNCLEIRQDLGGIERAMVLSHVK